MAEFLIDEQQFGQLKQSINELSNNIAKWQARQNETIQAGFAGMIAALTGADIDEVQQRINSLTQSLKPEADALEHAAQLDEPSNQGA